MERKRYKGIYLLPNVITLTSLFAGFYAMINALQGKLTLSIWLVLLSVILDGIDGLIARLLKTTSHFGAELDSLTDAIVFGLAPAIIAYVWLSDFTTSDAWMRAIGLIASFYVVCTVLRLARFNTQMNTVDKGIFRGLPSPAAAALVVTSIWLANDLLLIYTLQNWLLLSMFLLTLVLLSVAMVSHCSYYSLKKIDLNSKVPFLTLSIVAAFFVVVAMDFLRFVFAVVLIYAVSGPVIYGIRSVRKQYGSKYRRQHRRMP